MSARDDTAGAWYSADRPQPPDAVRMPADSRSLEPADAIDTLIQRCLAGDHDAWTAIVQQYRRRVYHIAYTFTGRHDEAEDLTQDVFVKVFRSLGTFDRRANFQTWLVSVSRNLCIDYYRSVRREREAIDPGADPATLAPIEPSPGPVAQLEAQDRARLLRQALSDLAPTLRTAVVLRDLQELSYQEIADRLGVPEGTVKSRINRGRSELALAVRRRRAAQDGTEE